MAIEEGGLDGQCGGGSEGRGKVRGEGSVAIEGGGQCGW